MDNLFEIIVFKQKIGKEDKKSYDLLSTKDFLNGKETVKKSNINTFTYVKSVLANTDVVDLYLKLSDLNFKSDNLEDDKYINGLFKLVSICITATGSYTSAYVLVNNSGLKVHYQVKANQLIVNGDGTITF